MGREKYIKEIENLLQKSPIVSSLSLSMIVKSRNKKVKSYSKQLTRNLIARGKMRRLTKGCYTLHEDTSLVVFCFKPAYLGLQDALSFHNLWEQETIPVVITTKKVRQGLRKVFEANILIRRINKKYLFGFDYYNINNFYLPYSDIEKTFIDMVYFKEKISKETINSMKKRINWKKFNNYLKIYPKRTRKIIQKLMQENKKIQSMEKMFILGDKIKQKKKYITKEILEISHELREKR